MSNWRVERDGNGHRGMIEVIGPTLRCVGFKIATDVSEEGAAQREKDAALIAAAPTMRETLQKLIAELSDDSYAFDSGRIAYCIALAEIAVYVGEPPP